MSDHESAGFKVVDRRQATTQSADEQQPVSAATPSGEVPDGAEVAGQENDTTTEPAYDTDSDADTDRMGAGSLPDPTVLLSLAAMQMDARTLALALLAVFDGQAWRAMGFLADPKTGETTKDLPSAQLAIDCVQFLLGKVENSVPDSERREMQRRLTDLRMNYLSKLREG